MGGENFEEICGMSKRFRGDYKSVAYESVGYKMPVQVTRTPIQVNRMSVLFRSLQLQCLSTGH